MDPLNAKVKKWKFNYKAEGIGMVAIIWNHLKNDMHNLNSQVLPYFHNFCVMTSREYNILKCAWYWNSNFWFC